MTARPGRRGGVPHVLAGAVAVVLLAATVGCATEPSRSSPPIPAAVTASPAPETGPPSVARGVPQRAAITFYAAADNDPPGSAEIAHPTPGRVTAGGTGTYDDPLTLATDPRELRPGVRVYYPPLQKYFVMEDDCAPCIDEWEQARTPHVDLWIADVTDPAIARCEADLTPDDPTEFLVNPLPGLPVDPRPLWDAGRCFPDTVPR